MTIYTKPRRRPLPPRVHYTPEELRAALLDDCERDLASSLENDPPIPEWLAYREELGAQIANLKAGGEDDLLKPQPY